LRPDRVTALTHGLLRRHVEVGRTDLLLQDRALQRIRAGAPLVEHDQPVVVQHRLEGSPDPRSRWNARLPRAAGQEEQHPPRRVRIVGREHVQ